MKSYFYLLAFALFFVSACTSDNQEPTTNLSDNLEDQIKEDTSSVTLVAEKLPAAPVEKPEAYKPPEDTEEVKKVKEKQKINSQFADTGCCSDDAKRTEACCCEKIVEEYRKIYQSDDLDKLTKLSADVIFNDCKKNPKWRAAIELVEEEDEEEE